MPKNKINLLSTISLPPSLLEKTAKQDIDIDMLSFVDVQPTMDAAVIHKIKDLSKQNLTVVFTSSNAAETVIKNIENNKPGWSIYCTQGTTKKIVGNYFGEGSIIATAVDALSLADKIIQNKVREVTFFCGNQRRDELPQQLINQGIPVNELIVYETILTPQKITKNYNGILFFSSSGVNSFFSVNRPDKETILFAIGHTTGDTIKKYRQDKIIVSEIPAKEVLIELAIQVVSAVEP